MLTFNHFLFTNHLHNPCTATADQGVIRQSYTGPAQKETPMKTFMTDVQQLKDGLIIFKRTDVQHRNWYCRIKIPNEDRYKTTSLKTSDITEAKKKAFHHDHDVSFRVEHNVPIFEKSFEQVAREYSDFQKRLAASGQITMGRWTIVNSYIELHLIPYVGTAQITTIGEDEWDDYPRWRKEEGMNRPRERKRKYNGAEPGKVAEGTTAASDITQRRKETKKKTKAPRQPWPAKDGTIVQEMKTFRGIMNFAAKKRYIAKDQVPDGDMPQDKARREAFTPQEYKHLYTFSRKEWVPDFETRLNLFYRTMAHNFMLVMTNTGMRPSEARNLRWRDVDVRSDKGGNKFLFLNVRGKDKYRELVAPITVATYLDRIREISKATKPDDFVFTTHDGTSSSSLYGALIAGLLEASGLLYSSSGSRRSTYCFRHTYATFRLMHGTDVYFLAKQMGTSVKMIELYYGHITPSQNADAILQGLPGWELIGDDGGETASDVNEDAAGKEPKPRTKQKRREGKDLPTAGKASRSTRRH